MMQILGVTIDFLCYTQRLTHVDHPISKFLTKRQDGKSQTPN